MGIAAINQIIDYKKTNYENIKLESQDLGIVGERRKKFIESNPNLNLVAICDKLKEKKGRD